VHKSRLECLVAERTPMSRRSGRKLTIKQLLSTSERVLRQDHPNPDRVGCPPRSTLEQLPDFSVEQLTHLPEKKAPFDRKILLHILTECYPCYRELQELRAKREA
jgi:hypothetical protein